MFVYDQFCIQTALKGKKTAKTVEQKYSNNSGCQRTDSKTKR